MIGAEFSFEEATSVYAITGDAAALKHSIQVHTWTQEEKKQGLLTHNRGKGQSGEILAAAGQVQLIAEMLRKKVGALRPTKQLTFEK